MSGCRVSGPGRLTEALGITHAQNALALHTPPLRLQGRTSDLDIVSAPRIGITKAVELPWCYWVEGVAFSEPAVRVTEISYRRDLSAPHGRGRD